MDRALLRMSKEDFVKNTKTKKSARWIYVSDYILDLIRALPRDSEEDYIFPYTPNVLTRRFPQILKKHDLPHCRFHDLRHSFASVLHEHGMDEEYIRAIGGWASDKVMKKIYTQISNSWVKSKSSEANTIFEQLLNKA